MSTGKRFLITALTFLLALSLLLPSVMQRPAADTQTGFILLSPGRNGQITLIFTSLLPPPPPGMQGYSPPAGTVAIASGIYANYTPDKAIDGVLSPQSK